MKLINRWIFKACYLSVCSLNKDFIQGQILYLLHRKAGLTGALPHLQRFHHPLAGSFLLIPRHSQGHFYDHPFCAVGSVGGVLAFRSHPGKPAKQSANPNRIIR